LKLSLLSCLTGPNPFGQDIVHPGGISDWLEMEHYNLK